MLTPSTHLALQEGPIPLGGEEVTCAPDCDVILGTTKTGAVFPDMLERTGGWRETKATSTQSL